MSIEYIPDWMKELEDKDVNFIKKCLFNVKIIEAKSFLQDGYEEHLLDKISIYDENMNVVKLPDSTCIIVIEKE